MWRATLTVPIYDLSCQRSDEFRSITNSAERSSDEQLHAEGFVADTLNNLRVHILKTLLFTC